MMTRFLFKPGILACVGLLLLSRTVAAGFLQLASPRSDVLPPAAGGGGYSGMPILSADGRFVLFASSANNLVVCSNGAPAVVPIMPKLNVFLRDRASNTTTLVSVNLQGTGGGSDDALPVAISTNGQFALFESSAGNLVANDTNNAVDVFLRDVVSGTTTLVSVSTNGGCGNGDSRHASMSADGSRIAFVSDANNLVPLDTNGLGDVLVRDLQSQTTTLASVGATSTYPNASVGGSDSPELSADGRFVLFYSAATNVVPGVARIRELYVRDLIAGTNLWVSADAAPVFQSVTGGTNLACANAVISANGQFVAFEACTNPVSSAAAGIILRYSLAAGSTEVLCTNANVPVESFGEMHHLDISPDGRFIAFVANTDDAGLQTAIYLWDAQTGTDTLVSMDLLGEAAAGRCDRPLVSADGRFVAFLSDAPNLTANPLRDGFHLYRRDVLTGSTGLVDVDGAGTGCGVVASSGASVSEDGSILAFASSDGTLVPLDSNQNDDVFVRDFQSASTELVSIRDPLLASSTPEGGAIGFGGPSLSGDGSSVAYFSAADHLVPDDTNGCCDVFVRNLRSGATVLVSINTNGTVGNAPSTEPCLSADGRYVAFTSRASDLVSNDTNGAADVFVRDLPSHSTILASVIPDLVVAGTGRSQTLKLSSDGRYLLFRSRISIGEKLYLRDLMSGTTATVGRLGLDWSSRLIDMTPDGRYIAFFGSNSPANPRVLCVWDSSSAAVIFSNTPPVLGSALAISPNGGKVAYVITNALYALDPVLRSSVLIQYGGLVMPSRVNLEFSKDGQFLTYSSPPGAGQPANVYLYDLVAGTNVLLSKNPATLHPANGTSDAPAISTDGRFIAYRSTATDLVPQGGTVAGQIYVYDRWNDSTSLLSESASGGSAGDSGSQAPVFSANGRTVMFCSWASNLDPSDFNQASDVFAYAFLFADVTPGAPGQGPVITWPFVAGHSYFVEYKDDLGDSVWQRVSGDFSIVGNRASLIDPAPATGHRFYRVAAE